MTSKITQKICNASVNQQLQFYRGVICIKRAEQAGCIMCIEKKNKATQLTTRYQFLYTNQKVLVCSVNKIYPCCHECLPKEPGTPPYPQYRKKGSTCLIKIATNGIQQECSYFFVTIVQIMLQKLNNSSKELAFRSIGNAAISLQHIENYISNNIA